MTIVNLIIDLIQSKRMRKIFLITTIALYFIMGMYHKMTSGFFLYNIEAITLGQLIVNYLILGLIRGVLFAALMSVMIYSVICMLSFYLAPLKSLVHFLIEKVKE